MTAREEMTGTRLVVDVDGTLAHDDAHLPYGDRLPRSDVIARVNELYSRGVQIVIYSARNMRTYESNLGLINLHTLPVLVSWLERHGVCYHEIYMGKPWCGTEGFYVRANGIRPDRFLALPLDAIEAMLVMSPEHKVVAT
ncbi:capsular biosynthesis protein [Roseovarius amoyensis]|uniref:capsular biosynthesis protein n=1 Tax=Roseovarius amoyensis TaxID=2211448 RepID=UPI001EF77017|nr:capsular biosynthesis protein [Roseovarius amoyensis]